jgi:hypothetical protein
VARLATTLVLCLHHHWLLLPGLRARWLTSASRISPSGSWISLPAIVSVLATFALGSQLLAGVLRIIGLQLFALARIHTLGPVNSDMRR